LKRRHPDFVRVVEKEYKNHPRKEVQMAWKKALERGLATRSPRWVGRSTQLAEKVFENIREES
jgi:hypothetical protein